MRQQWNGKSRTTRGNALWGSGKDTGAPKGKLNASWGKGGRRVVLLCAFALALVVPAAGVAGHTATKDSGKTPLVPASLLAQAQANPQQTFQVIVQGTGDAKSDELA